jgi:spore coat protein A, manganese oxidase
MTRWSRRQLLRRASLASTGAFAHRMWPLTAAVGMPKSQRSIESGARTLNAMRLTPFADALPLPERMAPIEVRSDERLGAIRAPYYRINIREITAKLHRDLPPTKLWSYGASAAPILIEARKDEAILIDWFNHLPAKHILPLDRPMKEMSDAPETRTVTHLHGGRVPCVSDGYPEDWFGPASHKLCLYPNGQNAAALWMHDHAMGVSRMNVIAGLMGLYILRDQEEVALGLPDGRYEVPLLIYDRSFQPDGQLYYPNPPDEGAWAQEFLGDALLVNGKVQPFLNLEPRRYRFRIVNAANSRFLSLTLSNEQEFYVIGSDQGLLSRPIGMKRVVIGPAERTDIVVDFAACRGQHLRLMSDSLDLLQFRVGNSAVIDASHLPDTLRKVERISESESLRTRLMTLNEYDEDNGEPMVMLLNRKHWSDPITEIAKLDTTEIWSLVNLTQDTHPIHLHLVRFQILDRQNISVDNYLSDDLLRFTSGAVLPPAHEMGWKDVVQCPPGTVTRIIVPFTPYAGRYLWHCHILEHEANDMMRPYQIVT